MKRILVFLSTVLIGSLVNAAPFEFYPIARGDDRLSAVMQGNLHGIMIDKATGKMWAVATIKHDGESMIGSIPIKFWSYDSPTSGNDGVTRMLYSPKEAADVLLEELRKLGVTSHK